jgi:sec-independent protein translocase protein TatB
MFDIGISEIMVIAVVALIVLGPEKLPKTARTLGHLFGRLQRYVADVKADINRELALEDLKKLQAEVSTAAADFQTSMSATAKEVEGNIRDVEASLNSAATGTAPPAPESEATPAAERGAAPVAERGAAPQPAPESLPPARAEPVPRDTPQQASLPGFDRG